MALCARTIEPPEKRDWPRPARLRAPRRPEPGRSSDLSPVGAGPTWAAIVVAGLTLAAIAIPSQMATARLAGFAPQVGFLALIAGAVGFALFGANRWMLVGANSTIAPIFAGALTLLAASGTPDYAASAAALALSVGLILVLVGVFRLGFIADLLSIPVTTGFLAGIAVHIVASQAPALSAVPSPPGPLIEQFVALGAGSARPILGRSASASAYSRSCWPAKSSILAFPPP